MPSDHHNEGGVGRAAMMMAAGLGNRMRPLTDHRPKPLVELAGRTLLDRGLERLEAAGVETVVVNVHYLAGMIEAHLSGRMVPRIVISDERGRLLDTGGGIANVLDRLGGEAFFVVNSDSVWQEGEVPLLEQLRAAWKGDRMDCLLALSPSQDALGYNGQGDFERGQDGRLTRRPADAVAPYVNTGAYLVHPRLFTDLPAAPFSMNLLWDRAIDSGRLYGVVMEGLWMHVGTPEALGEAEARLLQLEP